MSEYQPILYELPGVLVEVHKPADNNHYCAKIDLSGRYPAEGQVACNQGRTESLHWLEGHATIILNNIIYQLGPKSRIRMNDGDRYAIEGQGKGIVFVKDEVGGSTIIEEF